MYMCLCVYVHVILYVVVSVTCAIVFSCCLLQAVGYGLVLLDGNLVNINKLKKLNLGRIDKLFRVSLAC